MTATSPLYTLSIFALFLVIGGLAWLATRRRGTRGEVAASPEPSRTDSRQLADLSAELKELQLALKAHVRDFDDFEEQVRRWQGRVNRQAARDGSEPKGEQPADDDPSQLSLIPTAGAAASAADSRRGQRFTRSQLMAGRR